MGAEIVDHGWKQVQKNLKQLQSTEVKVGLLSKAGSEVVSYAGYNEFGTSRIPSRPFMRQTFEDHEKDMINRIAASYKAVSNGADIYSEVNKTGLFYKGLIQKMIGSNMAPENKPGTIRQKGSSKTLIDTGRMRQSIDFEVT